MMGRCDFSSEFRLDIVSVCEEFFTSMGKGKGDSFRSSSLLQHKDHSAAVKILFFGSATPKVISVSPKRPFLSSSGITWWSDAKTWLRSIASPLRMRSHCEEGIPLGEFGTILTKNLAFEISRL